MSSRREEFTFKLWDVICDGVSYGYLRPPPFVAYTILGVHMRRAMDNEAKRRERLRKRLQKRSLVNNAPPATASTDDGRCQLYEQ